MAIETFSAEWEIFVEEEFGQDLFRELLACGDVLDGYFDGNISRMARDLGLSQSTLYRTFNPDLGTKPSTLKSRLFRVAKRLEALGYDFDEFKRPDMPDWDARLAPPNYDFEKDQSSGEQAEHEELEELEAENERLRAKIETLKEVIAEMDARRHEWPKELSGKNR